MSDESANPVVEPEIKADISPLAEDTTPKPDIQPPREEVAHEEPKHPLEPGGDRFKEVWARTKKAEAKLQELEADRQREREERIRLEERLASKEAAATAQPEMTWAQLEAGIDEGRWTRAQAQEYKDKMTEMRLEKKLHERESSKAVESKVLGEIEAYKAIVPDVVSFGSESRQKVEREFAYMVQVLGMPNNQKTELLALRSAFGDVDIAKKRFAAKQTITPREPFMETHSPQSSKPSTKDFSSTLSPEKKAHYEKMLRNGQYKDWAEVEAEEKWVPKTVRVGR